MELIGFLMEYWCWFVGDELSVVDLVVVVYFLIFDYMGDVFWYKYEVVKDWYVCIKFCLSFRFLLFDWIMGMYFVWYYDDLDF